MAEETLSGAGGRASALLADIAERRWDQVRAGFTQRMADALDAAAWSRHGPRSSARPASTRAWASRSSTRPATTPW